ncbi:MAG: hypothetical protein EU535_02160 [Promethearchaeota archaeon]|nr:MAG: hypothetical protein EU535_02160 [Candidatus Lokiarchaeota archaeon]
MPYIVVKSQWPADKTTEVVNKAFEIASKFPEDPNSENVIPNCVKASDDGIVNITIVEVKKGKLQEAFERATKYWVQYHSIAGFRYSVEVWMTQIEAFSAIGRTPPN